MKVVLLAAAVLLTACAHKAPDGPADTEVAITDEGGEPLLGNVSLWSQNAQEKCVQYGSSCSLAVPAGDYTMTFRKERAGRPGSSVGGPVQGARGTGCLRARVHIVPGQKVVCRKKQEAAFNCAREAVETMDCGAAAAVRYGYKPRPDDLPPADQ